MIVLDGVGDRPNRALGGKTPLEAAETRNLDALAERGATGMVHSILPWVPVGTQTGLGVLMGLARADVGRLARGPVEAAGAGLELVAGDVAMRCNFATLEPSDHTYRIVDRRAGRIVDGVPDLLRTLDGSRLAPDVELRVAPSTHHRAVALLRGPGLSARISDTDPGAGRESEGVLKSRALSEDEAARKTADLVNQFVDLTFKTLGNHPVNTERQRQGLPKANGLITRGAGMFTECRNLIRHLGLSAAVVTGEGTAVGLARMFGFSAFTDSRFTASVSTDLDAKVSVTLDAIKDHDFTFLHIKGPDVAAHDHEPELKRDLLERIDAALEPLLSEDLVICVAGDHSTDSISGRHTGDPVPFVLAGHDLLPEESKSYAERSCRGSSLGHLPATSVLCACLDLMNTMRNHRAYEHFFYG
jgi:2,3-bisphosphoglycerate-independent phosphoglycerate mutase